MIKWFVKISANKRYLELQGDKVAEVENNLNELLDLAPRNVEEVMRSPKNKEWEQDYDFYLNQKCYPQIQIMEGKDHKTEGIERRRAKRISEQTDRKMKEQGSKKRNHLSSPKEKDKSTSYNFWWWDIDSYSHFPTLLFLGDLITSSTFLGARSNNSFRLFSTSVTLSPWSSRYLLFADILSNHLIISFIFFIPLCSAIVGIRAASHSSFNSFQHIWMKLVFESRWPAVPAIFLIPLYLWSVTFFVGRWVHGNVSLDDPTNLSQIRADVDTLDNFPIMYTKSYNSDLFLSHK